MRIIPETLPFSIVPLRLRILWRRVRNVFASSPFLQSVFAAVWVGLGGYLILWLLLASFGAGR